MDSLPLQLLVNVLLIAVNAFFAASEIAVISLNKTKLRFMAEDGDKTAKRLLKLAETPTGFLSTIQIAITLAGFLNSAFAADNFAGLIVGWLYDDLQWQAIPRATLNTLAVIFVTIILSYFTLVLGELVPKRVAMQKSYGVAKVTSRVIIPLAVIMKPFVWLLSKSTNGCLRLLRMKVVAEEESVSEEDIKMMVDLGEETGTVLEKEKEWIENIFEFNDTTVKEVMTPAYNVHYIKLTDTRDEIENLIKQTGKSRFPVCKTNLNDVVGIIHAKDFFIHDDKPIEELMRTPYFVPETTKASDLFSQLQSRNESLAVIVDEYGSSTGIVTKEDLLEEIVGNIYDEHDKKDKPEYVQIDEDTYKVKGEMLVSDLASLFDIELEEDAEYDTVGGLILSCLDYVPNDGTKVNVEKGDLEFTDVLLQNRRIIEATVHYNRPVKEDDEDDENNEKEETKEEVSKEKEDK